jgi:hypothetical protein
LESFCREVATIKVPLLDPSAGEGEVAQRVAVSVPGALMGEVLYLHGEWLMLW